MAHGWRSHGLRRHDRLVLERRKKRSSKRSRNLTLEAVSDRQVAQVVAAESPTRHFPDLLFGVSVFSLFSVRVSVSLFFLSELGPGDSQETRRSSGTKFSAPPYHILSDLHSLGSSPVLSGLDRRSTEYGCSICNYSTVYSPQLMLACRGRSF